MNIIKTVSLLVLAILIALEAYGFIGDQIFTAEMGNTKTSSSSLISALNTVNTTAPSTAIAKLNFGIFRRCTLSKKITQKCEWWDSNTFAADSYSLKAIVVLSIISSTLVLVLLILQFIKIFILKINLNLHNSVVSISIVNVAFISAIAGLLAKSYYEYSIQVSMPTVQNIELQSKSISYGFWCLCAAIFLNLIHAFLQLCDQPNENNTEQEYFYNDDNNSAVIYRHSYQQMQPVRKP